MYFEWNKIVNLNYLFYKTYWFAFRKRGKNTFAQIMYKYRSFFEWPTNTW